MNSKGSLAERVDFWHRPKDRMQSIRVLKTSLISLLATFLFSVFSAAQVSSTPTVSFAQIDAIFASLKSSNAPGAAVLVIHNGKPVFHRGYGVTDLRTLHAIDDKTNFRLASFTKQFTAACIMLLARDGKLRYDEPLTDIFPEFPAYGKSITVRNLLNHTSGLPDYEEIMMKPQFYDTLDPQIHDADVLKLMEQQTSGKFPPGSQWEYSNSGYVVLAMIVEKVSGEGFGEFLHQRIFVPLKMTNTLAYEKGKNEVPHRAYGHTYSKEKNSWQETDQSSTSATLGDGGIYTSLDDLEKWDRALREHTLLSAEEMQPALTPVQPTGGPAKFEDGTSVSYGFGWFLDPYRGHKRMFHDGGTIGFRTTIQRFPDDALTIIVLSNRADTNPQELALKVADLYLVKK
jgi:CubicO group peptidase (beta-lactamase class C family)